MKISIRIPNDFGSERDYRAAVQDCYPEILGLSEEQQEDYISQDDQGIRLYEHLADVARTAGLQHDHATDWGNSWKGSKHQVEKCIKALPSWAYYHIEEVAP